MQIAALQQQLALTQQQVQQEVQQSQEVQRRMAVSSPPSMKNCTRTGISPREAVDGGVSALLRAESDALPLLRSKRSFV